MRPVCWTIAGSDPSGGAGVQMDLKVMSALGVQGCSVTTAQTSQNSCRFSATEALSTEMVADQIEVLLEELPPAAIKIGMLSNADIIRLVARFLREYPLEKRPFVVCDPLLKSSSGGDLLVPTALRVLKEQLFPQVDLLTPNLPEAKKITGSSSRSLEIVARMICSFGPRAVLLKGGHSPETDFCRDYWTDGDTGFWLKSPRLSTTARGTGCALSSAIAAFAALGKSEEKRVLNAKWYLNQCLRNAENNLLDVRVWKKLFCDEPNLEKP